MSVDDLLYAPISDKPEDGVIIANSLQALASSLVGLALQQNLGLAQQQSICSIERPNTWAEYQADLAYRYLGIDIARDGAEALAGWWKFDPNLSRDLGSAISPL